MTEIYQQHIEALRKANTAPVFSFKTAAENCTAITHESMIKFAEWLPKSGCVTWSGGKDWQKIESSGLTNVLTKISTEHLLELFLKEQ